MKKNTKTVEKNGQDDRHNREHHPVPVQGALLHNCTVCIPVRVAKGLFLLATGKL